MRTPIGQLSFATLTQAEVDQIVAWRPRDVRLLPAARASHRKPRRSQPRLPPQTPPKSH